MDRGAELGGRRSWMAGVGANIGGWMGRAGGWWAGISGEFRAGG